MRHGLGVGNPCLYIGVGNPCLYLPLLYIVDTYSARTKYEINQSLNQSEFPIRSVTNRSVQSHKKAKNLNFRIVEDEEAKTKALISCE